MGTGLSNGAAAGKRLFIGNINYEVTERELHDLVATHAGVEKVDILKDKFSGRSRGFGFVELVSSADAGAVVEALNGHEIRGRKLRVEISKPRDDYDGRRDRARDFGGHY